MSTLIEAYWFKTRYVMKYSQVGKDLGRVKTIPMKAVDNINDIAKGDNRLKQYLESREGDSSWVLFEVTEEGERYGYSFLHTPVRNEWNDSLCTRPGEARIGSMFVYPPYRGQGVRGELFAAMSKYAMNNNLRLWSVIEKSNVSSIKAATKTGEIAGINFLIKVLGFNLVSITTRPLRVFLLFGHRRERR